MPHDEEMGSDQTYKVKLTSGRILGPLNSERVRLLILKNQITGVETAREYPQGEWKDINQIPALRELLFAKLNGSLSKGPYKSSVSATSATTVLPGATEVFSAEAYGTLPELPTSARGPSASDEDQDDKTMMAPSPLSESSSDPEVEEADHTRVANEEDLEQGNAVEVELRRDPVVPFSEPATDEFSEYPLDSNIRQIAQEKTVVFQRSSDSNRLPGKRKQGIKEIIKGIVIAIILGTLGYDLLLSEPDQKMQVRQEPIRPKLPSYVQGKSDPSKSIQIYSEAIKHYLADNVQGYRTASEKLRQSAAQDITNVKALAMLASSYLNLIDSSNKDENYFSVISKLIDMSRAKAVDLPETVIADVEFFLVVHKAEAAQNRIVEYTKAHQTYGLEMFYYLALSFLERGDAASAARYLGQFPDNKVFSAKVFYLKGLIAEKLKDTEAAIQEYKKAIQFNRDHVKSRLRLSYIFNKQGTLREAAPHLEFLMNHANLLSPRDLGEAYFLHAQLAELMQKWDIALGDVERAVKLDPENHDYLLELYTLRAKAGDSLQMVQKQARMYYFLGEGEKLVHEGKYQDALVPFLQARQANDESPLPLVKIGDMFHNLHDVENAKANYKLAADRAPTNIQVWSKYIKTLILSYEWDEATKAMDKFRKLPVSQSAIDKAAADMYQKQGRFVEAQAFYKKAMARDVIDSDVYIAYAKSLMSTKNYKDAPFFFALALRFDPLNVDAIISTAKCVAETESIERAISMLQDELRQSSTARAEFLAAIAEFQIQKGDWEKAQQNVDQATKANPEYAYSWKLQAQIYMNREGQEKDALDRALLSYKSYSERNASDPSGYLERYKIFVKKAEFEKAKEELNRIYSIYPKYPSLHYYLGALYAVQGNHKAAAEEFKLELANNPSNVQTLISYGRELLDLEKPQDALNQFSKAMQLAPLSADAKQNAGWANYYLKNYMAAVTLLRAALVNDRANPLIFRRLGLVYREMGDMASACGAFKKYLEMEPDAADKASFQSCL
jgi:tetratricopeptide (TPR) repeat protein